MSSQGLKLKRIFRKAVVAAFLCLWSVSAPAVTISAEERACAASLVGAYVNAESTAGLPRLQEAETTLYGMESEYFTTLPRVTRLADLETAVCVFPPRALDLVNQRATVPGANCFNATLIWFHPETEMEYVSQSDMAAILSRDFIVLPPSSVLQFGDVIAVWGMESLDHTMVLISPELVWHKASSAKSDPYTFENLVQAVAFYRNFYAMSLGIRVTMHRIKRTPP